MVVDQPQVLAERPERRVIFLGASNLAFGFRTIVKEARAIYRDPLDIVFALGHGRSYGCTSRVLGRQLPAILACRLWKEIRRRPPLPTTAFITDVGNDILYLRSPDNIIEWLETIVERLLHLNATIHISSLPLTSIRKLRPFKFYLLRSILFPKSTLTFEDGLQRVTELDLRIRDLAERHRAQLFCHDPSCYGFDPIHIRRTKVRFAWQAAMAGAQHSSTIQKSAEVLPSPRPRYRLQWGATQRRRQPAIQLASGTRISIY